MIRSWDLWDTLIGRYYQDPASVFQIMEKKFSFPGFALIRQEAERELYSTSEEVTLERIYNRFQAKTGISDKKRETLMASELLTELQTSFPIAYNASRVGPEDVIVSDMYLPIDFVSKLLDYHHIGGKRPIYISNNGKMTGRIWPKILKEHPVEIHTGDNPVSDQQIPARFGIRCAFYTDTPSDGEKILKACGFERLANLARVLRMSDPMVNDAYKAVYDEQATFNVPMLILISKYIPLIYSGKRVLMTARDCCNLQRIFPLINPGIAVEDFQTSRRCYRTATPDFLAYVRAKLGQDDPLLVDLHSTGVTVDNFFSNLGHLPKVFVAIQTSDADVPWRKYIVNHTFNEMMSGRAGFRWEIENLNLDVVGSVINVKKGIPVRAPLRYDTTLVKIQQEAITLAIELVKDGFDLGPDSQYSMANITTAFVALSKRLSAIGFAVGKYGIPDINDWPAG